MYQSTYYHNAVHASIIRCNFVKNPIFKANNWTKRGHFYMSKYCK